MWGVEKLHRVLRRCADDCLMCLHAVGRRAEFDCRFFAARATDRFRDCADQAVARDGGGEAPSHVRMAKPEVVGVSRIPGPVACVIESSTVKSSKGSTFVLMTPTALSGGGAFFSTTFTSGKRLLERPRCRSAERYSP